MGRSSANEPIRPYRAPAAGGEAKALPFGAGGINVAWSKKGQLLAFVTTVRVQSLYRIPLPIPADGIVQPERWISSRYTENAPTFSPDGASLLVSSERTGTSQIYRSNADGSGAVELTKMFGFTVGSPVWSPDGQRILFDARVNGNPDIWVMNADGSQPRRLTEETSEDVTPAWTPDGASFVFCSNRTGSLQLWRAPVAGGPATQLTREGGFSPRLAPDGKYFYYLKTRSTGELRRIPVDGGREEDVLAQRQGPELDPDAGRRLRLPDGVWGHGLLWEQSTGGATVLRFQVEAAEQDRLQDPEAGRQQRRGGLARRLAPHLSAARRSGQSHHDRRAFPVGRGAR